MAGPFGPDDPAEAGRGSRAPLARWLFPGCSDVWARSELVILAPAAVVFAHLVTAGRWERDFPGLRNVRVLTGGHEDLAEDTAFEFEMDGLRLTAQVSDFAAGRGWPGRARESTSARTTRGFSPASVSRSRALAGFAARGAAAIALRETDPGAAQRTLDRWAGGLKAAAERGVPGGHP